MSEQHSALILEHTPRPLSKKEQRKLKKEEKQKQKAEKREARTKRKAEKRLEKIAKKEAKRLQKLEVKNAEVHSPAPPTPSSIEELGAPVDKKTQKVLYKQLKKEEKAEKKRIEEGRLTLYEQFENCSFVEIEELLLQAESREEKAFYRSLLNLKLQIEQEKVIGAVLL